MYHKETKQNMVVLIAEYIRNEDATEEDYAEIVKAISAIDVEELKPTSPTNRLLQHTRYYVEAKSAAESRAQYRKMREELALLEELS